MKKILLLTSLLLSIQAEAAIVSVSGDGAIIPPIIVQEDAVTNTEQQGFNEQQGVSLASAVTIDGGSIAAGTLVDSHLIFYNTTSSSTSFTNALWTFDGDILGVISDRNGADFVASNAQLANGDYFTVGQADPFNALGLESTGDGYGSQDGYTILGNQLQLAMRVSEPGDWIRVVTAPPSAVPLPASAFLFGPAVLGFIARRRMKK